MRKFFKRLTAVGLVFCSVFFVSAAVSPSAKDDVQVDLINVFGRKSAEETSAQRQYAVPGGVPFGIRMYTEGVVVVGVDEVQTEKGSVCPAREAGLQKGDSILKIDGEQIVSNAQVYEIFRSCGGKKMKIHIKRDNKELDIEFTPQKSASDGNYHAGLWIRDSSAGIGMLTFYDKNTKMFGGLGHAVCDIDTGETMPLRTGDIAGATVTGCYKGKRGEAGELCGMLDSKSLGTLLENGETGVYGVMDSVSPNAKEIPVATKSEIHTGKVQILTTVDSGLPQYYDAEIIKIYANNNNSAKNFVVEVTDEKLIEKTGGIVQGMSGSPLIQDGRLVGAVTHVFVNNPLQGYGIYAQTMLETAKNVQKTVN